MKKTIYWVVVAVLISGMVLPAWSQSRSRKKKKKSVAKKVVKKPVPPARSASWKVAPDLEKRLERFQAVNMPFEQQGLSAKEVQLVKKLVEASQYVDAIYWRQSDPEGLNLLQELQGSTNPQDQELERMLVINGSRYDLIDNNKPFVGSEPIPPGRGLYPKGLTRVEIEAYVSRHKSKREELYSPFTVVRRRGEELEGLPYHIAYRSFLEPAANALREAADLSDDKGFSEFLRKRADALMDDDYYPSDSLWVDLKDPKFDVIFAPYETELDDLMGIKTSYGAAVLVRNEAESKKLALYQKYVPEIQEALPIEEADKPSKKGQPTPMEVMDAPYRAGDLLHGYQAVADNLPNDPRIHQEKGTKKIFFKNFMDARLRYVVLPVAQRLMRPDQAAQATPEGYMTIVVMHEIAHGLGPSYSRMPSGNQDIREMIGSLYSPLEEAKADVAGMFGLHWLVKKGVLPKDRMNEYYSSYVAGILRSVRFGVAEAHGRAEMMEFNYLSEHGVITLDRGDAPVKGEAASGVGRSRYIVDYKKMPEAIASLSKELLEIEATGDRERAKNWFAKYDKMPAELRIALQSARDVPVDFYPVFSFPEAVQ